MVFALVSMFELSAAEGVHVVTPHRFDTDDTAFPDSMRTMR